MGRGFEITIRGALRLEEAFQLEICLEKREARHFLGGAGAGKFVGRGSASAGNLSRPAQFRKKRFIPGKRFLLRRLF